MKVTCRLCEVARKELACARQITGKGVRVALLGDRRRFLLGPGERVAREHRDDLGTHPRRVKPRYAGVPAFMRGDSLKLRPPPRLVGNDNEVATPIIAWSGLPQFLSQQSTGLPVVRVTTCSEGCG